MALFFIFVINRFFIHNNQITDFCTIVGFLYFFACMISIIIVAIVTIFLFFNEENFKLKNVLSQDLTVGSFIYSYTNLVLYTFMSENLTRSVLINGGLVLVGGLMFGLRLKKD